jgi:hypothetical protein
MEYVAQDPKYAEFLDIANEYVSWYNTQDKADLSASDLLNIYTGRITLPDSIPLTGETSSENSDSDSA